MKNVKGAAMLEDGHIIALKDVILACREAETRYETFSSIVKDATLSEKFRNVADARGRKALYLETAVKNMGSLPRDVDPEKQTIKSLWTRLKMAVKDDELSVLFQEGITLEAETEDRCELGQQYAFSEGTIQALAELNRESTSFKQWLKKRVFPSNDR
jgi:uncharacterized protein (TIGR02284 family)